MNEAVNLRVLGGSADVVIDVGGSGIRCRLLPTHERSDINPVFESDSLGMLIERLRLLPLTYERLAIGATGIWGDTSRFDAAIFDPLDLREIHIADDGLTAHLGARSGQPGIVTAIGTGLVTVRMGSDGTLTHIGGYGLLLDDRGSGAWIGQSAVHQAIDAYEKVGEQHSILDLCVQELGPPTAWSEQVSRDGARLLAGLCSPLAVLARSGDRDARAIFESAGRHIARRLHAAASSSHRHGERIPTVFTGGGAAALDLLMPTIKSHTRGLDLEFASPEGSPLDGAELLLNPPAPLTPSKLLRVVTRR